MAEQVNKVSVVIDGRTLTLERPDPEQVLAWLGLANSLTGDLSDREQAEVNEDLTLLMDAILNRFTSDEDRRWVRRAAVLGTTKLSDVLQSVLTEAEEQDSKPVAKPKVRRAGGH